jgi:hypothetical protein
MPVQDTELFSGSTARQADGLACVMGGADYQIWANLTDVQAAGMACVVCRIAFLSPRPGAQVPVGRSVTGSQVFACTSHAISQLTDVVVSGEVA